MQLKTISFNRKQTERWMCKPRVTLILFCLTSIHLFAQKPNQVDIPINVSITPTANFNVVGTNLRFSFIKGQGAEQIITPSTIGKMWINYSSVVEGTSTNSLCISISSGNLPAEIVLKLKVGQEAGTGIGRTGKPVGEITLNSFPQAIISEIGTCYTGQGINKGHPLTFFWELRPDQNSEELSIEDLDIEVGVTYTIVNNE